MPINFNLWGGDSSPAIDYPKIKAVAHANLLQILQRWLPGGVVVSSEYVCAGLSGGRGLSCKTNINTGIGSDFANGETWGDAIDLIAKIEHIPPSEAAIMLSDFLYISDKTPLPPVIGQVEEGIKHENGKRIAAELWAASEPCPDNHPYLLKKQIPSNANIRRDAATGNLLIPLRDEKLNLWSLQRITPEGEKKITFDGKQKGNYHVIGGKTDIIFICEGYSSAVTVALITGRTAIMAINTGNLPAVAEKIVKQYPASKIVFAADNDCQNTINSGIVAAERAATLINRGTIIFPPATDKNTDWNDYALEHGAKACKNILLPNIEKRIFADIAEMEEVENDWLIEDMLAMNNLSMLFGPSGAGKSFLALDWAFHVATGKGWNNKHVKQGGVLYFCGEGKSGLIKRRRAWEKHHNVMIPPNTFKLSETTVEFTPDSIADVISEVSMYVESGFKPVYIIIDTLSRALSGGADENSSTDIMLFINMCGVLQNTYGCHVQPIHHTGHSDNKRGRGSSALRPSLDAEICILPSSKTTGLLEFTKTKDYDSPPNMDYTLEPVTYGDKKGQSSLIIRCTQSSGKAPSAPTAMDLLHLLPEWIYTHGNGTTIECNTLKELYGGSNRMQLKRALESLENDNRVWIERDVKDRVLAVALVKSEESETRAMFPK